MVDQQFSYIQHSSEDPLSLPRKQALERIKRIACQDRFETKIKMSDYIKMPDKPTRSRRTRGEKSAASLELEDEEFEILEDGS